LGASAQAIILQNYFKIKSNISIGPLSGVLGKST